MKKIVNLKLPPPEASDDQAIKKYIAAECGISNSFVTGFYILRRSIDARSKQVFINLSVNAFINEPFLNRDIQEISFKDVKSARKKVLIIGGGPAGLFAALRLLEFGIKPVILERGKDVRARRRDLAALNKYGILNEESNYCFGEGGAGTYSDGKLYTRSNKRGDVARILNLFVQFGAEEQVLYDAHPHIGTNKLPHIITAIRKQIMDCGGEFFFEKKVVDFSIEKDCIKSVVTADNNKFQADAVILATGHSARDIFLLLHSRKILVEAKSFALGVRVEHPQSLIDVIRYHCPMRDKYLPPASYSVVKQVNDKGVFSFCMCPGGIIAPAATNNGELVVNGWSPSKRNNPFANSGIVVQVTMADLHTYQHYEKEKPTIPEVLLPMYFQQSIERKAYEAGGGDFVAPAQRLVDFSNNKISASLPDCSYVPGANSADLSLVLPPFIYQPLRSAFAAFGEKMKGYFTNEAVVVATESRTSSPVRIPRDVASLHHPQLKNLYPCGEGAGYAGGIVSAAMDGEKVASAIIERLSTAIQHK